jgi:hypothetical protein
MPRRPRPEIPLILALLAFAAAAPAHSWEVRRDAPAEDFSAFHRRFSSDAYHYPRHGAAPLGLLGFEVYADATYDEEFDDEEFAGTVIDGDFSGGFLSVARIGARKGLPGGIDIGLAYGRALEGDIKLLSADLQYAILEGGLVKPALSVRLTGTRTLDADVYKLDQYGAELLLSKGFTILTPYVGGGVVYSKGQLDRGEGRGRLEEEETRGVVYAGLRLNLLLPKITVEVEKGETVQGAVRVGFGF